MKLCDALEWFDLNASDQNDTRNFVDIDRPNDQVQDEVCLIGKEKMKHKFTLKCGHSFEYDNILKELELQKNISYHKCPYCRQTYDRFIPYFETDFTTENHYEEYRKDYSHFRNNYITCEYVLKNGKNKGHKCGRYGHQFQCGNYCFRHKNKVIDNCIKYTNTTESEQCTIRLKNGCRCKFRCGTNDMNMCTRHYNMYNQSKDKNAEYIKKDL